jgi:transposase-like protein
MSGRWIDRCLDAIKDENGVLPDRMSTAELLVYIASQADNNACPYCRNRAGIMSISCYLDRFKCPSCGKCWEHAYRIIHSPVLLSGSV